MSRHRRHLREGVGALRCCQWPTNGLRCSRTGGRMRKARAEMFQTQILVVLRSNRSSQNNTNGSRANRRNVDASSNCCCRSRRGRSRRGRSRRGRSRSIKPRNARLLRSSRRNINRCAISRSRSRSRSRLSGNRARCCSSRSLNSLISVRHCLSRNGCRNLEWRNMA